MELWRFDARHAALSCKAGGRVSLFFAVIIRIAACFHFRFNLPLRHLRLETIDVDAQNQPRERKRVMSLATLLRPFRTLWRSQPPQPAVNPPPVSVSKAPEPHALTRRLVEDRAWGEEDMYLVDVGASGGIHSRWDIYQPLLRARGFDPLVREVERLNAMEKSSKVRYVAAFVGCRGYDALFPPHLREQPPGESIWRSPTYRRTSAARALALLKMDCEREQFNKSADVVYSERHLQLDDIAGNEAGAIDFIKIDTDGHDYEVLLGGEKLLREGEVLGLMVEAQLHGPVHDHANVLCNIDRFLRGKGFALFDLELYRYSRGILPGRFMYSIPAQTTTGQVIWGEALYLRDLAGPQAQSREWRPAKVLKLASLMDIFGLPDCAAEMLLHFGERLPGVDVSGYLNLLASQVGGRDMTFERYNRDWDDYARATLRADG
jgi:hypothetical protein